MNNDNIKGSSEVHATCSITPESNANNGLMTKIWGPPCWEINHAISFNYPLEPTPEHKARFKNYYQALGHVLPCRFCRESYETFITSGDTVLDDNALVNRESLSRWFYRVHEAVNNKLGMEYFVTYEDLSMRCESFRARCGQTDVKTQGCVTPLDYKAFSFKRLSQKDYPVIPLELAQIFATVVKIRGMATNCEFLNLAKKLDGDIAKLKGHESWDKRNDDCQLIIKHMRENAIPSIEVEGKWIGTPTIDELKLILLLSSNLNKQELRDAVCNLMKNQIYFQYIDKD